MTYQKHPQIHILLAGDDEVLLSILAQIFDKEGYATRIAPDEESIRSSISAEPPDIFIFDITRTPNRAIRTMENIGKEMYRRTIILASYPDIAHLKNLLANMPCTFIAKPFAMTELLNQVREKK